ncbi:rhomboid family intramembrane serine protease [Clostridium sp. MSJ-4]|uniref:Rhomboid family intramembrane serine protease n=1 Tax=Clostridium simiarum TaxID=2841506 RepID=A0ABS6F518_9CLOT|nr:rhomboid family intramembrane serine protease [Clostridium simiarum]MBU5592895.1 rhomboid family intramembrane serine protease [Clostridium simiarum]
MREKYINNIISALIKEYGFNVEEYEISEDNSKDWIVIRYDEGSAIVVIFSTLKDFAKKNFMALEYMRSKGIESLSLNNIILDDFKGEPLNLSGDYNYNFILLDSEDGKLLGQSQGIENFSTLIEKTAQGNKDIKAKKSDIKNSIVSHKATYALIIINILIFILSVYLSRSIVDIDIRVLLFLGAKNNILIRQGQYYRLLTAMFLHGGLLHVVLNMYALKATGEVVESFYGRGKFIIIYFFSGITSSLASYMFSKSTSVGASGAIFGLLGACLIFAFKMKDKIGKGFLKNIISVIAVNVFIGISISNIDNFGHIGGLIGGIIISWILFKEKS